MRRWLQQQWYRLGPWHVLLIPLSWLFNVVALVRRLAYQSGLLPSCRLPVPVIVVGNISVGGTGKTPLAVWLAENLRQQGFHPALISRGYGVNIHGVMSVDATSDPALVGDEPLLLARRTCCPVWVGRDRPQAALALLEAYPQCDVIISDDGLQHYRLQRDFEIVVIDGDRGVGNGRLLPAGPLRETAARLKTVDAVVVNGGNGQYPDAFAMQLKAENFRNLQDSGRIATATDFAGQAIYAIAGIGSPARFFRQLRHLGLQFSQRAFPDHHAFSVADLQVKNAQAILMTEKDAVKCAAFAQDNWWYLPVDAVVDQALITRILDKLRK